MNSRQTILQGKPLPTRIQSEAISWLSTCDSLHCLCGAGEPGSSVNTFHILGTLYMSDRLPPEKCCSLLMSSQIEAVIKSSDHSHLAPSLPVPSDPTNNTFSVNLLSKPQHLLHPPRWKPEPSADQLPARSQCSLCPLVTAQLLLE